MAMDESNGSSSNSMESDEERRLQLLMNRLSVSTAPPREYGDDLFTGYSLFDYQKPGLGKGRIDSADGGFRSPDSRFNGSDVLGSRRFVPFAMINSNLMFDYRNRNLDDFNQRFDFQRRRGFNSDLYDYQSFNGYRQQRPLYSSLEQLTGLLHWAARDKQGSCFLIKKIYEGKSYEIEMIIAELLYHIHDLMLDQFGKIVIEKLFGVCNSEQIGKILLYVIGNRQNLLRVCSNIEGSRGIQKFFDHLNISQIYTFLSALKSITVLLSKSCYGHHVIKHCLEVLHWDDSEILLNEIAQHCVDIASDKSGCYLLQSCLLHARGAPRRRMIAEITENALLLAEHPTGNYIVQFIVQMKIPYVAANIIGQLKGNFVTLSMNKYASNVVEVCLKLGSQEHSTMIVRELINSPHFLNVVQDVFGNYVIQSALSASEGAIYNTLADIIQANYAFLHTHPHGNRVLEKLKKEAWERGKNRRN